VADFALVVVPWWLCPGGFALVVVRVVPWFGVPRWFVPWWLYPVMGVPWWFCPGGCAQEAVPWWRWCPWWLCHGLVCPGGGALVADFALVVSPWWLCPGGFALVVVRVVPLFGVSWWFVPWWLYPVMGVP
jgi:hypothetical protein